MLGGNMAQQYRFEIECDDLTQQRLHEVLPSLLVSESDARFIERRNLDGDTATWVVIATLASQALPHLLAFLTDWRKEKRKENTVTRIKIGQIEIENPTPEDLEILRERLRSGRIK